MNLTFEPERYYTDLSLFIFILAVLLKKGVLKSTLLLNSVLVGLIGNIVFIRGVQGWVEQGYNLKELLYSNFVKHTIPMTLSLIILSRNTPQEISRYVVLLLAIFFIWSTIPYNGRTMTQKIRDSYDMSVNTALVLFIILTITTSKTLQYLTPLDV